MVHYLLRQLGLRYTVWIFFFYSGFIFLFPFLFPYFLISLFSYSLVMILIA